MHFGREGTSFVTEVILTSLLVLVVLNTATRARVVGPNAAIAVGGTIALCGLIGRPISGAAMNPARWLGPALVAGEWTHAWIYVAGPLTGAIIAVVLTAVLHPVKNADEVDAAEGERGARGRRPEDDATGVTATSRAAY
jgi:aquaporin Z